MDIHADFASALPQTNTRRAEADNGFPKSLQATRRHVENFQAIRPVKKAQKRKKRGVQKGKCRAN